jgi:hypothetical protein
MSQGDEIQPISLKVRDGLAGGLVGAYGLVVVLAVCPRKGYSILWAKFITYAKSKTIQIVVSIIMNESG